MKFNSMFPSSVHVYLDDASIGIAQVKKISGVRQITGFYHKNISGLSMESTAQEINAGLTALKINQKSVSLVLPSKFAITKNIEVPSLDKDEIENIIRLQGVRHTPYAKEELVVTYVNLDRVMERYTKVLLVIVSNDHLRKKTDVLEMAGLDVEKIHLSFEVLVKMIQEVRPFQSFELPCCVVYAGDASTDFIIVQNSKPHFIRSVPVGAAHLAQDEPAAVKQLVEEFKKTSEAYQGEDQGVPLRRLLVTGAGSRSAALLKSFREDAGIDAEELAIEAKLPMSAEARAALDAQTGGAPLDAFADGLAEEAPIMDLMPDDLKLRKSFRQKGKEILIAAIFIFAIFLLSAGIFISKYYFRNNYLKSITTNFEEKEKETRQLEFLSEETRVAKEFRQKRSRALLVLDEFQKMLPKEMYLSEILMSEDGRVSIKGTSDLMSIVFSFVTELENSPYFKTVTSDSTKSRKENDKDVSDFVLSAIMEGAEHGR